jgi:TRAP-type C4-dicarboxylate transport system substrate-binding protein
MGKRIWIVVGIVFFCIVAWLVAIGPVSAQEKKVSLRMAAAYAPGIIPSKMTLAWEEKVTKATNGRITFENFWLGTLCKSGECTPAAEKGLVDAIGDTWLYYPKEMPLNQYSFAVPFGPQDPRIMLKVGIELWKKYPKMREEIEKNNLKVLRTYVSAPYNLVGHKSVSKVEDLKGMKIGAGGIYLPKWLQAVGAASVAVPIAERYNSMQTKVLDGSLLPIDNHDSIKLTEIAKFVTNNFSLGSCFMGFWAMNRDAFNKLSSADQELLLKFAEQQSREEAEFLFNEAPKMIERWKTAGAVIKEFPSEQVKKWMTGLPEDPWEVLAKTMDAAGLPGKEFTQTYYRLCKEYGHEFPTQPKK